ncbi:MAG TPA: response regulator [Caldilineae bacterium]|nr:response regulator [Caldilineae bacterium]
MDKSDKTRPLLLVAERDPFMRDTLRRTLGERFDLEFVDDGAAVIQKAKERSPALIILEVLLPTLDGFQVCRRLKNDSDTRHIPVLMFTSLLAEKRAAQAGCDGFLLKPLHRDRLLQKIHHLLTRASKGDREGES